MKVAGRALLLLLCLFVTTACRAARAQRVCGILDGGSSWPGEVTYLRLIEPGSGAQHTLVRTEEALFNGGLSPDGTKVLYTWRDATGRPDTWVMPLDGSEPRRLLRGGAPTNVRGAAWSSGGGKAVLRAYADDATYPCTDEYYVVDVATGRATRLPMCGWAAAWSPTDPRLAILCSFGEDWGLWVIDTDTGDTKRLLQGMQMREPELAWSPDAREIAVVAAMDVAGLYVEYVYAVDVESGAGRALTPTDGYDERMLRVLRWSPAGDKIAFREEAHIRPMSAQGSGPLFVVDVETGEENRLVDYAVRGDITWSPDGREIAFHGPVDGTGDCCSTRKIDLATGEVTPLAPGGDMLNILAWSWVTFVPEQGQ